MSKPKMPLGIAKQFLGSSIREEDIDARFTGAREIRWSRDGRQVAYGLCSSVNNFIIASVTINDTKRFSETCFKDAAARSLEHLGISPIKTEDKSLDQRIREYVGSEEEARDNAITALSEMTPCPNCGNEYLTNGEQFCDFCGTLNPGFNLAFFNLTFKYQFGDDEPGTYATAEEAAKACEDPNIPWFHSVDKECAKTYKKEHPDERETLFCSVCGKKL